ncbi:Transient receptor putative cation channel subfamily M member 2, partial [Ilyodon furcidens]
KEEICCCGYAKTEHTSEAIKLEDFTGDTWDKHRHVHMAPTDAFGNISFDGLWQRKSKYARVSEDTRPDVLYKLLTNQWKLSPPNLLISVTGGAKNFYLKSQLKKVFHRGLIKVAQTTVTGGAKNFYLKSQLKKVFHRGLIKVAQTTGAWIITGGTHTGVMRHVGKAVRDYALSNPMQGNIVAIGIATWGVIHNRDVLVHKEGCFPATYKIETQSQGRMSCLDNNHTHFLLVDDGTNGRYGVEIELRARLEKYISAKNLGNKESGTIPVVCVVLDGGPGTLNTIYSAMLNDTPCVILEGSGRIADVIAQVSGLPISQVTTTLIQQLLKRFFGQECEQFSELNIIESTRKIQDIIRMSHLLTVFRAREDGHGDVDVAILQALLKGNYSAWQKYL